MTQCGEVKTGLLMQPDQEPTRSVVPQHDLRRMSFGDRPPGESTRSKWAGKACTCWHQQSSTWGRRVLAYTCLKGVATSQRKRARSPHAWRLNLSGDLRCGDDQLLGPFSNHIKTFLLNVCLFFLEHPLINLILFCHHFQRAEGGLWTFWGWHCHIVEYGT
jgi:hypothetical protein